jgi:steroid 5-alpha reductase family enzyme
VGSHLFSRITSDDGQDSRFDNIRGSPTKFLVAFMAQATWVSLCLMPVTAINSLQLSTFSVLPRFTASSVVGLSLFVSGLLFEVIADRTKTQWAKEKKEKKHSEEFLTRGLWSRSRHPNYFGEITLWTGIAITSAGALASTYGQQALGWSGSPSSRLAAVMIAGVSPAFTTFLLTKVRCTIPCIDIVLT